MPILSSKRIFLIDGMGAIASAVFLGYVLVIYQEYIGMPVGTLKFLSSIAVVFAIYSLANFFIYTNNWLYYIRLIAIANSIYCLITLGLVLYHFQKLSVLGITYFLVEIVVIIALVNLELKVSRHIDK